MTAGAHDVVVIGAGQAGLAVGYYLRRTALRFVILDAEHAAGGAWRHGWDSLRLFSPPPYSSLPGWMMPGDHTQVPSRDAVLHYLTAYEERYQLPIQRPVRVSGVRAETDALVVETDRGVYRTRAVVSATGTWSKPYLPDYPGLENYNGEQLHSAMYHSPQQVAGQRVLIIGGGNSAAQILAEVQQVAEATWVTLQPPTFLPDNVDGRYLFEQATARYQAQREGRDYEAPLGGLGDIVMTPSVKEARARGVLQAMPPFQHFTSTGVVWPDGKAMNFDVVLWCTGFRPALDHLAPLGIITEDGRVEVVGTRSVHEPRLWLVGYGEWSGFASATLIGVDRSARATVAEIEAVRKAHVQERQAD